MASRSRRSISTRSVQGRAQPAAESSCPCHRTYIHPRAIQIGPTSGARLSARSHSRALHQQLCRKIQVQLPKSPKTSALRGSSCAVSRRLPEPYPSCPADGACTLFRSRASVIGSVLERDLEFGRALAENHDPPGRARRPRDVGLRRIRGQAESGLRFLAQVRHPGLGCVPPKPDHQTVYLRKRRVKRERSPDPIQAPARRIVRQSPCCGARSRDGANTPVLADRVRLLALGRGDDLHLLGARQGTPRPLRHLALDREHVVQVRS